MSEFERSERRRRRAGPARIFRQENYLWVEIPAYRQAGLPLRQQLEAGAELGFEFFEAADMQSFAINRD